MLKKGPVQRLLTRSGVLALVIVAIGIVVGVASASGASARTSTASAASGKTNSVIILLKDRAAGLGAQSTARKGAVSREESPLIQQMISAGATHVVSGSSIPFVTATVSQALEAVLKANPAVKAVLPNVQIQAHAPLSGGADSVFAGPRLSKKAPKAASPPSAGPCGTALHPEHDPEALSVINATPANNPWDGAGVKVAYIAGGIDTTIPDFQRSSAYASPGYAPGAPVVTMVNFSGDPIGDTGGDASIESFLDASSIVAQGNTTYDLSNYVNSSNPLPSNCDITITGDAPGASLVGIDVFSNDGYTTTSNFVQAIGYAVSNGVQVLNESFGGSPFPDTALDAIRIADDDAVQAGVTVVTSSGDAGVTNTVGSPATDQNLISVGASTTFRGYLQSTMGGINASSPNASNGNWLDNNISSISSSGFSQGGSTIDLVAPGDLNWIDCSTNTMYPCSDDNGDPNGSPIGLSGGTSESSPLTAGAAADVIQAYEAYHHGTAPSPALVKQILMSTATDINAPAEQQGAGLLNILAAVKEATSINGSTHSPQGSLLISPNQINITQPENVLGAQTVTIANNGTTTQKLNLSTRTLTKEIASPYGYVCLNPTSSTINPGNDCNGTAPTTNYFNRENGLQQVYTEATFTVPKAQGQDRLNFSATTPYTMGSVVKIALYDPSGTYAGYSLPQGEADYANIQVTNPKPGTWTAVFFDSHSNSAAAGEIDWEADTWTYGAAGTLTPSALTIAPGHTATTVFRMRSPYTPGDAAQSIVVKSSTGATTTIPVVVRTLVPTGGEFYGEVTGGNGRGFPNPAQTNTYAFNVPQGMHDVEVEACFENYDNAVQAYLVNPEGEAVASSANLTLGGGYPSYDNIYPTECLDVYKDNPEKGQWQIVLNWLNPVSGEEISSPFIGFLGFNNVNVESNLPSGTVHLTQNTDNYYYVDVTNTGEAPEAFFLDPRTSTTTALALPGLGGDESNMTVPGGFGLWEVPPDTTELDTSLESSVPVTYDTGSWFGDPDLSTALSATGVVASQADNSASLDFTPTGGEVAPGLWFMSPSQIGPYGSSGVTPATGAAASATAYTPAFDTTVSVTNGGDPSADLWQVYDGSQNFSDFYPLWLPYPGCSGELIVDIHPTASVGTHVTGSVKVDDGYEFNYAGPEPFAFYGGGDELASLPFSYTVSAPISSHR